MIVHATTVAIDGRGVLIMGAAGAGKSGLALGLMALGAQLVADDRTLVDLTPEGLVASCPSALRGLIEARGLGILNAPFVDAVLLQLCVDLDTPEPQRLPPRRTIALMERELDLVLARRQDQLAPALIHYVRYGRRDDEQEMT